MKNFKKVLALVLVLASLLGLATMAGAATEYKDADKINADYTEAIKVLDLIETMQGYPDGNFKPTATITREEAAKVIAIFDNKDADISTYYTSINPFTDEKGRWGESYVGYGYRAGIIAGMNATTYAPTSNVTGTQFLKMALVTLGYDQEAEGFVGASWAVNVLALAKRIGLIDGLADGWKPENDLTREEAAQILLNALNADMVEYGQEAKALYDFKKSITEEKDSNGNVTGYRFNGKLYLTVAGAVKTGKALYKDFDMTKEDSTDAFYRPYTKWTKDHVSVEIMKAPKATFTKKFSACDLLVALGVKESDTKTKIYIDAVYCDGDDETTDFDDYEIFTKGDGEIKTDDDGDRVVVAAEWKHGLSNCPEAKGAKHGAQGTLTQVFYNGKDADGNKHYTITSIETWLGKVGTVTNKTTSRDDHKKANGAVKLYAYLDDFDAKDLADENNADYCDEFTGHCDAIADFEDVDQNKDGTYTLAYGDPTGLKKDDYVLFTYSLRTRDDDRKANAYEDAGVQSVDVTEGKDGRLSGYKFGTSAGSDPTSTRIDSEYVTDSQHFHLNYNLSKTNAYGTYTFFYDAYGNVIGMKDAADSSKWGVVDRAWITFENKGTTVMNADVVDLDAKTTTSTVKKFTSVDYYMDLTEDAKDGIASASAKNFAYEMAKALQALTNGEGYKDFTKIYDHLFKVSTDKDGVYSLKVAFTGEKNDEPVAVPYGDLDTTDDTIKTVNGKPVLEVTVNDETTEFTLTSNTQFLVHNMDGTYSAYTGYKNVPSLIAHYAEVVFDSDYDEMVAEVVYLTNDVYVTSDKVVAYVGNGADMSEIEVVEDGDTYYNLTIWVNGEETNVYVDLDTLIKYFDASETVDSFVAGFYELQYTEIDGVKTAKVTKAYPTDGDADDDKYLVTPVQAQYFNGTVIRINGKTYTLTDDCALYGINGKKVYKVDAQWIIDRYEETELNGTDMFDELDLTKYDNDVIASWHNVYVAVDGSKATAIYLIEAPND